MEHWELTLFEDDGVTPVLGAVDANGVVTEATFSTDPAHPRPYLDEPGELSESEILIREGRATIATATLVVLDKRTEATDPDSGIYTSILANASGESARNGRRALLQCRSGAVRTTAVDGVVTSSELNDDEVSYRLQVRDQNEQARRIRAFVTTAVRDDAGSLVQAPCILPRGVLAGYGLTPSGTWLLPPATPLRGVFTGNQYGGVIDLSGLWLKGKPGPLGAEVPPSLVMTGAMRRATRPTSVPTDNPYWSWLRYDDVAVLWKPAGGAWEETVGVDAMFPLYGASESIFNLFTAKVKTPGGDLVECTAIASVALTPGTTGSQMPADGTAVDVIVCYIGEPTPDYPFVYEGTHGELLRNGYRGDYSAVAPAARFDEAAFLALDTPARLLQEKPADDWKAWTETPLKALGAAAPVDTQGQISPVRYQPPPADAVLPVLNDANVEDASWAHSDDDAVNVVTLKYPGTTQSRRARIPPEIIRTASAWGRATSPCGWSARSAVPRTCWGSRSGISACCPPCARWGERTARLSAEMSATRRARSWRSSAAARGSTCTSTVDSGSH